MYPKGNIIKLCFENAAAVNKSVAASEKLSDLSLLSALKARIIPQMVKAVQKMSGRMLKCQSAAHLCTVAKNPAETKAHIWELVKR